MTRTLDRDLYWLTTLAAQVGTDADPGRVEVTLDGDLVVAQVIGARLAIPLAGRGPGPREAVRALRDEAEAAIDQTTTTRKER